MGMSLSRLILLLFLLFAVVPLAVYGLFGKGRLPGTWPKVFAILGLNFLSLLAILFALALSFEALSEASLGLAALALWALVLWCLYQIDRLLDNLVLSILGVPVASGNPLFLPGWGPRADRVITLVEARFKEHAGSAVEIDRRTVRRRFQSRVCFVARLGKASALIRVGLAHDGGGGHPTPR
jgi:hypothetical protein